ncbi:MAG: trans-sulfuration enzyme family protein [Terriglobales bacterium]
MDSSTLAVHAGERATLPAGRPISTPIYASTTFLHAGAAELDRVAGGEEPGYLYGRYAHPTAAALEAAVLALELAVPAGETPPDAVCYSFASGMAAMHAAILASGAGRGDLVLCAEEVYGGTLALLTDILAPTGLEAAVAPLTVPAAWAAGLARRPKLVIAEAISNPRLRVPDLAALAAAAHAAGAKLLVDATFASPVLCRPVVLGADFSVHSATKYLAGHGDTTGGVVIAQRAEEPGLSAARRLAGGVLGPFEAWLVLRGLKTLPLRIARQCATAARIAAEMATWPGIEAVDYPGLPNHPDHAIARQQFGGCFGGMLSFALRGAGRSQVFAFLDALRLVLHATSLGDVQTLISYPLISSHRGSSPRQLARQGIGENLLRLSVGLEAPEDLLADLRQALAAARA